MHARLEETPPELAADAAVEAGGGAASARLWERQHVLVDMLETERDPAKDAAARDAAIAAAAAAQEQYTGGVTGGAVRAVKQTSHELARLQYQLVTAVSLAERVLALLDWTHPAKTAGVLAGFVAACVALLIVKVENRKRREEKGRGWRLRAPGRFGAIAPE